VRFIVVPEVHRKVAEAAVRAALLEDGMSGSEFVFTLIRLPRALGWRVHASSASGTDDRLARLIQQKLRDAGL
jgi:hypothetical protein